MPYQLGDRTLQLDVPWEHDGVQYPANWLRLSTAQDRAELGITWVDNSPTWPQKWYWGYDSDGNLIPECRAWELGCRQSHDPNTSSGAK